MPNLMERLEKDPSTRKLLEQPDYRAMMQELAINPTALGYYLQMACSYKSIFESFESEL